MGAFTSEVIRQYAPACWFPLSHAEAIVAHSALSLDALCDRDGEAVARAAAAYHAPRTYTDPYLLLREVKPSLLCLATRTHGRAELIVDAVDAGVRALHVEKPLCNTVRELDAVAKVFDRDDIFVTYGAIRRQLSPYRAARALANSGVYGPLREIRVAAGRASLYGTNPH
jgi:predicted dehydrogenase